MGLPARDPVPLLLVIFFPSDASHGRRRGTWPTGACAVTDDAAGETTPCAAAVRDTSADTSDAAYDRAGIPPKRAVREGVFGRPARRRHCASNSLVGVTGGPALRAGNGRRYRRAGTSSRIVSRKWPRTSRRGPGTCGPGAPRAGVLKESTSRGPTTCGPPGTLGCLGRALADKQRDGHDCVGITA